jgi:hypothetical protein
MGKIKVVHPDLQGTPVFTCSKCGSHTFCAVVIWSAKYSGPGVGYARAIVCANCQAVQKVVDCDGKNRIDNPKDEPDVCS